MRYMDTELDLDDEPRNAPLGFSSRLSLAILAFFGFMSMATQEKCMDAALICMMNHTEDSGTDHSTNSSIEELIQLRKAPNCSEPLRLFPENLSLTPDANGEFTWSNSELEVISAAVSWGVLFVQIPAAWLASRYGGRLILGLFAILASVTTLVIPVASRIHIILLVMARFVGGLGMGAVYPSMHAVWANWAPPEERAALVAISYSGAMLGYVGTYPFAAVLCRYGFDGGWPSIFYILGGFGALWCIAWWILANDSPLSHPRISEEEKHYLVDLLKGEADLQPRKEFKVPWCRMLTSPAFLALLVSGSTCHWGFHTFRKLLPDFMEEKLYFVFIRDPIIAALPFIGLWFFISVSGIWSDKLIARGVIGHSPTRKIMQCLGTFLPAGMIIGMTFLNCGDVKAAVSMYVIGYSLCGFQYSGYIVNYLDVAPYYAAIMFGIVNTIGMVAGAVGPILMVEFMPRGLEQAWQYVFYASAAGLAFGGLTFVVCGTGDLQDWAFRDDVDYYGSDDESSLSCSEASVELDMCRRPRTGAPGAHSRHDAARRHRRSSGEHKKHNALHKSNSRENTAKRKQEEDSPSSKRKDSISSDLPSSVESPADFYDALEETIV